jgi:hypothetical protein
VSPDALRERHRPKQVRVLFIGESRPAGGTFFYSENSNLYRYTREAFVRVFQDTCNGARFLDWFRGAGCYLDDLCLRPVNQLGTQERTEARREGIGSLGSRLAQIRPSFVIYTPRAIDRYIREAVREAGVEPLRVVGLPFPAMGHQGRFVEELVQLLNELRQGGCLA